ncbi:MAG TPA: hypothetical protein VGG85_18215 [Terracidiphilus sp.]|jgi:protein-tyrosine phosphatase
MSNIFWIDGNPPPGLAVVACPAGDDWLKDELRRLKAGGIDTVVSHLEKQEAGWLGLKAEQSTAEKVGLAFLPFPIPDTHVPPDVAAFRGLVSDLALRLRRGEHIGVHCRGSIGRATVTAACTLIHLGWKPQTALTAIEAARGLSIPDTREQLEWILAYKAQAS